MNLQLFTLRDNFTIVELIPGEIFFSCLFFSKIFFLVLFLFKASLIITTFGHTLFSQCTRVAVRYLSSDLTLGRGLLLGEIL